MAGGSRRLDIVYHLDTSQADTQAEGFAQRQKSRITRTLTDEEVAERARLQLIRRTNQERISASVKVQEADKETTRNAISSMDEQKKGADKVSNAIQGGVMATARFGAAMLGLQSVQGIASVFAQEFEKTRQYASKVADDIQRMRENVRELQALRGQMGQTGPGVAHLFKMAGQTGQTTEEVQAMEQAGLGVGELAIGKSVTKEDFDRMMVSAGKMQATEGGNSGAYGEMMGLIALQAKGKLSPEEAEGRLNRMFLIQQPGKFATMSQAIGQYSQMSGLVSNDILSPEEGMGLVSAMSAAGPVGESGAKSQQFARALLSGRLKARGMAMSPDVDFEKTSEYMKGLGITGDDSVMTRGKKIAADLAAQKQANANFNADEYLQTRGFGNMEDRGAIMGYAGLLNSGRLEKIEAAQNAPLDNGAVTRRFNERVSRDPFFARRLAQTSEKAVESSQGMENEDVKAAYQSAFARLRERKEIGAWKDSDELYESTGLNYRNMFFGDRQRVGLEAQHALALQANKVGVDFREPMRFNAKTGERSSEFVGDDKLKELILQIRQAGGNPSTDSAGTIEKAADKMLKASEVLERAVGGKGVPAPMQGKTSPQPTRS
jgi:hypothetical protein